MQSDAQFLEKCKQRPWLRRAMTGTLLITLAACASLPSYRPKESSDGIGYSDEQITLTRYRVTYSGDTGTPRSEVEDYLLRRAAEIAVANGYANFEFDKRNIEAKAYFYTSVDSWNPEYGLGFSLGRRYQARENHFAKWSVPAFWSDAESTPIARYTASSEIVLLSAEQAASHPTALSAREILLRLGPAPTRTEAAER